MSVIKGPTPAAVAVAVQIQPTTSDASDTPKRIPLFSSVEWITYDKKHGIFGPYTIETTLFGEITLGAEDGLFALAGTYSLACAARAFFAGIAYTYIGAYALLGLALLFAAREIRVLLPYRDLTETAEKYEVLRNKILQTNEAMGRTLGRVDESTEKLAATGEQNIQALLERHGILVADFLAFCESCKNNDQTSFTEHRNQLNALRNELNTTLSQTVAAQDKLAASIKEHSTLNAELTALRDNLKIDQGRFEALSDKFAALLRSMENTATKTGANATQANSTLSNAQSVLVELGALVATVQVHLGQPAVESASTSSSEVGMVGTSTLSAITVVG